jgi:hypothetical protein
MEWHDLRWGLAVKVLVIGSTGHQHVHLCVKWKDAASLNLVDYHCIVVNVRSLTDEVIASLPLGFFDSIRLGLARLLMSGGQVVALGDSYRQVQMSTHITFWNYAWSPIVIGIRGETGTTMEIQKGVFSKYLTCFRDTSKWQFYYYVPRTFLTTELISVCGNPNLVGYICRKATYVANRYGQMLAGALAISLGDKKTAEDDFDAEDDLQRMHHLVDQI